MVLYLTGDLMMASTVQSVARQIDIEVTLAPSIAKLIEACSTASPQRVLVDLQTQGMDVDSVSRLVEEIHSAVGDSIPVIGYAQHVQTEVLMTANRSGFHAVVTRGNLHRNPAQFLTDG